jgi:murein DD-endopeptidase MepM/ murein hydrolase activator NlpD
MTSCRAFVALGVAAALLCAVLLPSGGVAQAAENPTLGAAAPFAVLSGQRLTSVGAVSIIGDVGVGPGFQAPPFAAGSVQGTVHSGDGAWSQGHADLERVYGELSAGACDQELGNGNLGGTTLRPGITCVPAAATLAGALTLDAGGDAGGVFVVRLSGTLTSAAGSEIKLANGAQACNVVLRVAGSTSIGRQSRVRGNLLGADSVTVGASATVEGRVLSRSGGVSLNANTVSVPECLAEGGLAPVPPSSAIPPTVPSPAGPPPPAGGAASGDVGVGGSPVEIGPLAPPLEGGGDDTSVPPPDDGGFPPALAAQRDSVVRSGARDSKALVAALAPLADWGLSAEQIAQVGYGRFPIGGEASYTHDWWFPRFGPGWRLHQGSDIFAERGTPVRSPSEGTVRLAIGGLGGTTAYVVEPNGTYYYLAHLAGYAPGLVEGARVTTGQIIGYVGDSGNARGTPPHLHFEVHPGGGAATDPKPFLDQFLTDAMAQVPALLTTYDPSNAPPAPTLGGVSAGALVPVPAQRPAAVTPAPAPASVKASDAPSGVSASTFLWVSVAAVMGLALGKVRERPVTGSALVGPGLAYERTRPTMRSISRRIAAARSGETRAKGRQLGAPPLGGRLNEGNPGWPQPIDDLDFGDWLVESPSLLLEVEPTEEDERAAEERLLEWAKEGFGWPVPRAALPLVEHAISERFLPAAEAQAVRELSLATTSIHPVLVPAGSARSLLAAVASAALVASDVPTLVCCPNDDMAANMERSMDFRSLTGLPALGISQVLREAASGNRPGFPRGTVVIVAQALDVPATQLERFAGHLSATGGCLRLLMDELPALGAGTVPLALPSATLTQAP